MSLEKYRKIYETLQHIENNERDKIDPSIWKEVVDDKKMQDPEKIEQYVSLDVVLKLGLKLESVLLQVEKQKEQIKKNKTNQSHHLEDTLRSKRLSEKLRYEQRLQYILSIPRFFAKINPEYMEQEKAKYRNPWAVEARLVANFIQNSLVIDPGSITEEMKLYILNGNHSIKDPYYTTIKEKLSHPYYLQYTIPGKKYTTKHPYETTSRITFFKNSSAIGVFRSADTHPINEDPTKHEQRKIDKNMDMYISNSSYDVITQQYQSIQHIIKNKEFMQHIVEELNHLVKDTAFGPDKILQINQTIDIIKNQVNPHTLMARLYNLSKIPFFKNRVVQQNLLFGAINKLEKREKQLGLYLYYMLPQLQALEKIHNANKENMETLHRNTLMCADGNNPWSFAIDKSQEMEQFNKHDIAAKIQRALRQHTVKQKDHLIGIFYTMHHDLEKLLKLPKTAEVLKTIKIMVYTHRIIMAAEQLKQDIQLGKIQRPNIYIHTHFEDTRKDIQRNCDDTTIQKYFEIFYELIDEASSQINKRDLDAAEKTLARFKSALDPIQNDAT